MIRSRQAKQGGCYIASLDESGHAGSKIFLLAVLNNPDVDCKLGINAARTLLPFMYPKIREAGKKEG
ncbi:hypothetical protein NTGZN8_60068 [Candidatus Nitrotoga fabula]|uniref:Uncharacterized protein n=1 Tax=Candidatus Nitrotoga fabula TaxID=2182327 RepID=A0A916FB31_9PROT|nr:hypothetical protein NTGZN8_60068 [Candidatus Nitrotoga fabula]